MRPILPSAWLALLAAFLLAACGGDRPASDSAPIVLAASSMQEALQDAADAWADAGHAPPVLSFAASSALARQVEQGAPADIFISADQEWMDEVDGKGLLRPGTRADISGNSLVVIARDDRRQLALETLPDGERLAIADPAAVPAGRYARAALETLGLWDGLAGKVVPAENVRAALALVERGEASLGIVYATDAAASDKIVVVSRLPAGSHPPIRYPLAILASSARDEAAGFRAFLLSDQGQRILAQRGFETAE